MNFNDIYMVSPKREIVERDQINLLQHELKVELPADFADFLIRFGSGEFCGCLSFFGPAALVNGQVLYKQMYSGTFLWDAEKSALSHHEVMEAVWLARALDGDEVVFFPRKPPGIYVLPRNSEVIQPLGATCAEILDWFASSGKIYRPTRFKWFCTSKGRCRLHIVKDEELDHREALSLVDGTFGVNHADLDEDEEFSVFFCQKVYGYVFVYSDSLDIHHDSDFDTEVCRIAEEKFYCRGFRSVEHHCP